MPALLFSSESPGRLEKAAILRAREWLCAAHVPSDECNACRRIARREHPDFFIVEVEPDGNQILVDRAREALAFAVGHPFEARGRAIWVRDADRLTDSAGNALLKSLEEPGQFLLWILTTTAPGSVLATIVSRCEPIPLPRPTPEQAVRMFRERGLDPVDAADAEALRLDPDAAEIHLEESRENRRIAVEALADGSLSSRLTLATLAARGDDDSQSKAWAGLLASVLRDAAVLSAGAGAVHLRHGRVGALIERVAEIYSPEALRRAALEADRLPGEFERSARKELAFSRVLLHLSGRAKS